MLTVLHDEQADLDIRFSVLQTSNFLTLNLTYWQIKPVYCALHRVFLEYFANSVLITLNHVMTLRHKIGVHKEHYKIEMI